MMSLLIFFNEPVPIAIVKYFNLSLTDMTSEKKINLLRLNLGNNCTINLGIYVLQIPIGYLVACYNCYKITGYEWFPL